MKFYYYKISNIENGGFYIGITINPQKRKREHFRNLKNNSHTNYKMQKDYNIYGEEKFTFEILEELDFISKEEAYNHEKELISKLKATTSYNILEGGLLNPVYNLEVQKKLRKTHQAKYDNVLQYSFDGKQFHLIHTYNGLRDASRDGEHDFRAIQTCTKTAQQHHNYYWVLESKKEEWLKTFLNRFKCCVAKINEETNEIEDTALTINEFAIKYNTTYSRIYSSLLQNNRCERKYKFIRITAQEFANINNLSL